MTQFDDASGQQLMRPVAETDRRSIKDKPKVSKGFIFHFYYDVCHAYREETTSSTYGRN